MSLPLVVFRADASAVIGRGHVVRCLALAQALRAAGWRCGFATSDPAFAAHVGPDGIEVLDLGGVAEMDEAAALARHWPEGVDVLVLDHYGRDKTFESACRSWARTILTLDDGPNRHHECDLLLDPGSPDQAASYQSLVPPDCRLLLGPSYALVRRPFLAARGDTLRRRRELQGLRRILIYFGTDTGLTATRAALEAVARSGKEAAVDVVVGAGAHMSTLRKLAERAPQPIRIHTNVTDMAAVMAAADLAFGAPGSASWERACLGLPSVVTVLADNQRPNAALLAGMGAAVVVADADLTSAFASRLRKLAADPQQLRTMSAAAARLCDGRGALRVMLALLPPASARDGRPVTLRPVTEDDGAQIYAWQSHEATRRHFRNPAVPTPDEHRRWLTDALDDADRITLMVDCNRAPAGLLRLDPLRRHPGYEVSILSDPERYGRGVASAALALGRRLLPGHDLHASIRADNAASRRLFRGATYTEEDDGEFVNRGTGLPPAKDVEPAPPPGHYGAGTGV